MIDIGPLALAAAAIFFGAAFYVGFAEHYARQQLDDRAALAQWKPAYHRGTIMQAPLAIAGFLLGLAAWWQSGQWLYLAGAIFIVANWPYTLFVIMPVNKTLAAFDPAQAGPESRTLLEKWARFHAGRTSLGVLAVAAFLAAMLEGSSPV